MINPREPIVEWLPAVPITKIKCLLNCLFLLITLYFSWGSIIIPREPIVERLGLVG